MGTSDACVVRTRRVVGVAIHDRLDSRHDLGDAGRAAGCADRVEARGPGDGSSLSWSGMFGVGRRCAPGGCVQCPPGPSAARHADAHRNLGLESGAPGPVAQSSRALLLPASGRVGVAAGGGVEPAAGTVLESEAASERYSAQPRARGAIAGLSGFPPSPCPFALSSYRSIATTCAR